MSYAQCHSCHKLFTLNSGMINQHHCGLGRKRKKRLFTEETYNIKKRIFKPQGISLKSLKTIELTTTEIEILRLKNVLSLQQTEIAQKMSISQSTLARTLSEINKKITLALINGWGLKIN